MNVSAMCMMTMTGTGVTANGVKNALTRPFLYQSGIHKDAVLVGVMWS